VLKETKLGTKEDVETELLYTNETLSYRTSWPICREEVREITEAEADVEAGIEVVEVTGPEVRPDQDSLLGDHRMNVEEDQLSMLPLIQGDHLVVLILLQEQITTSLRHMENLQEGLIQSHSQEENTWNSKNFEK
jgi:hypothetical protein